MGRERMTRDEAEASNARWIADNPGKAVRKAYAGLGDDTTLSRFVKIKGEERKRKTVNGQLWFLNFRHKALELGRTIFPRTVKRADTVKNVLVSGHSNVKIGRDVRKGLFRGYWIYTLTLEERTTCPRTCHHWETCYGNNMPWAKRIEHGKPLMRRLEREIADLLATPKNGHPPRVGILIRLHALGDFYSPEYVFFWDAMLRMHPRLAIYGYIARRVGDPIGDAIMRVKARHQRRFAIRWSDGAAPWDTTRSIMSEDLCPPGAFVCPEQTGKTACCATCGACWTGSKPVAFIEH